IVEGTPQPGQAAYAWHLWRLTPDVPAPAAPAGLIATAASAAEVDLAWSAAGAGGPVHGFVLERSTHADFSSIDKSAIVGPGATSYADTGLTGATSYYYRVRAFNGAGQSPDAAAGRVTTPAAPPAPSGLTAVNNPGAPGAEVDLSWVDNGSAAETGLAVQRSTLPDFSAIDNAILLSPGTTT